MLARKKTLVSLAFVSILVAAAGCSVNSTTPAPSNTAKPDGGTNAAAGARPQTKPKTSTLKTKIGPTPPEGAKSIGAQTKPTAGAVTIPITDVEVYTFEESFADGLPPDVVSWAFIEGVGNYLWINGSVTCSDGSIDTNGGFVMAVKPDGAGSYLFSLPGCPSEDLFGCDFDATGEETTCGACAIEGETLVCAVASQ